MPALTEHKQLMHGATYASVAVATCLVIVKVAAYIITGSVAILSSLLDSFLDLLASGINLFAVRHSLVPADREHRYGHGKAEAIAGLVQAILIIGSAGFLIIAAVSRLIHVQAIEHGSVGVTVMVISILLTAGLVKFQKYVVQKTGSVAIAADSLHYVGDLLMNLSVIAALLLSTYFDWHFADPLFALAIAVYLLKNSRHVMKESLAQLMDEELPDAIREQIKSIGLNHPKVINVHELRTRSSGRLYFIQLHLEMDGNLTLNQAHEIAHEVDDAICKVFPNAEVIIHEDPEGLHEGETRD